MQKKSICRICKRRCGIIVEVDNEKVIGVTGDPENIRSKGYICPKGKAIPDTINAPDRLLYPQQRTGDSWQTISWDTAYDEIAAKMLAIKKNYGPESLNIFTGEATLNERLNTYLERFGKIYGTPNHKTGGICHLVKQISNSLIYGGLLHPDYDNSQCIILWGTNVDTAEPLNGIKVRNRIKQHAKLIVIDPALTPMAKQADIHLPVRPGTDGALALGFINVIISEKLYDGEFIRSWTIGFEELSRLASDYTPEKVEGITWVPAELTRKAARLYATTKPASLAYGNSTEHHSNAVQAMRAVAMLQALTGNVDVPGGGLIKEVAKLGNPAIINTNAITEKAVGEAEHPIFAEYSKGALGNMLADYILKGTPYPVKGVLVIGANPILTYPNALKMQQAFSSLELLSVYDMFLTQTARLAHIILPAAHFLEREELNVRDSDPVYCERIVPPPGETRTSFDLVKGLFKVMGYAEFFPWDTEEDAIRFRLKPTGLSIEQAKTAPEKVFRIEQRYRKYEKNGFSTPSGKVEFYSQHMADNGYDPLPAFIEPKESYYSGSKLLEDYPYMLTVGARIIEYYHSQFRNIPALLKTAPGPSVEMHPQLADRLNIKDGDVVQLRTKRGSIELSVKISEIPHPRIMQMVEGWDEANMNILTDDEWLDPVSGFPPLRSVMCNVKKIETAL